MKMKNVLSLLISRIMVIALLFSIAGCTSNQSSPSQNTEKEPEVTPFSEIEIEDEGEEVEIGDDENTGGF